MALTFDPIGSTSLAAVASTITFSGLGSGYTDLMLVIVAPDTTVAGGYCLVRVNQDSGANYSRLHFAGNGSAVSTGRGNSLNEGYVDFGSVAEPGRGVIHFMSYAQTNTFKSMLISGGARSSSVVRQMVLWRSTAAITSIQLIAPSTTFAVNTRVDLFGIKAA